MREKNKNEAGLSVHCISSTHIVLICIDIADPNSNLLKNLVGFAIKRKTHSKDEEKFLQTHGVNEDNEPNTTLDTPLQKFRWSDYSVKPNETYTYSVYPVYPSTTTINSETVVEETEVRMSNLFIDEKVFKSENKTRVKYELAEHLVVSVTIKTEGELHDDIKAGQKHSIFFNRCVAGSQAYSRQFGPQKPHQLPRHVIYKWLSRGLEEGLLDFIAQANSKEYTIHAAFYEFKYEHVLQKFKECHEKGATVKIIYDCKKKGPKEESDPVIDKVGIRDLMVPRQTGSYIAHNKFIVLLKNEEPIEVWTGSVNITESGIFGQSNVGHIIRDKTVATLYEKYWQELVKDPTASDLRRINEKLTPILTKMEDLPKNGIIPIFSPRLSLKILDFYTNLIQNAKEMVCLTGAFGINEQFAKEFSKNRGNLRYILLEKEGKTFPIFSKNPANQIAIGSVINSKFVKLNAGFLEEYITGLNDHVKFVHTKYMLIDPLSDCPIVITGSGNFSLSSILRNDENMVIIVGDTRVADIYLCEFMRLFTHFKFRNMTYKKFNYEAVKEGDWWKPYYKIGTTKWKERLLFCGYDYRINELKKVPIETPKKDKDMIISVEDGLYNAPSSVDEESSESEAYVECEEKQEDKTIDELTSTMTDLKISSQTIIKTPKMKLKKQSKKPKEECEDIQTLKHLVYELVQRDKEKEEMIETLKKEIQHLKEELQKRDEESKLREEKLQKNEEKFKEIEEKLDFFKKFVDNILTFNF